jgi:hypothetical protein
MAPMIALLLLFLFGCIVPVVVLVGGLAFAISLLPPGARNGVAWTTRGVGKLVYWVLFGPGIKGRW